MRRIPGRVYRLPPSLAFLLLAWFCAQQPQGFVVDVVHWLRGAAQFSHQQQLAEAVNVALVAAVRAEREPAQVAAEETPPAPESSALPEPVVVSGKVPLVLVLGLEITPPADRRGTLVRAWRVGCGRVDDVPTPVPRRLG